MSNMEKINPQKETPESEKGELVRSGTFKLAGEVTSEKIFQSLREIRKGKEVKNLAEVERKLQTKEALPREDLIFLYGIDIKGFGYERDPRIKEIVKERNPDNDLFIIFNKDQIALTPEEINEKIEIYIGELKPKVFDLIQRYGISQIYTSFPKSRIFQMPLTIGGKSKKELGKELKRKEIRQGYQAYEIDKEDLFFSEKIKQINLVKLSVKDLGFSHGAVFEEIYQRVQELGLELCSAETAVYLRLQYGDQPIADIFNIIKNRVSDGVMVSELGRRYDGHLWLRDIWVSSKDRWFKDRELVFYLRPRETEKIT